MLLNEQVKFKNWHMLILSQYHIFESYKINIYRAAPSCVYVACCNRHACLPIGRSGVRFSARYSGTLCLPTALRITYSSALLLKDSVTRFFASGFFHESVSPQPQNIPLGPFWIFSKIRGRGQICHWCQRTGGKIATGVNDAGGKWPPVFATSAANLPPE